MNVGFKIRMLWFRFRCNPLSSVVRAIFFFWFWTWFNCLNFFHSECFVNNY